jgi:predicted aldo/keto reductase-like oxidoreductase
VEKRRLKNTSEYISLLGFGGLRLPLQAGSESEIDKNAVFEMVDHAIERGINYFDTAYGYSHGKSELVLGEALSRHPRDKYNLATKMPLTSIKSEHDVKHIFDDQLRKCRVDFFDFYLLHNINRTYWETIENFKVYDFLKEKQKHGLIRHLGFSFHDTPEFLLKTIDTYSWDFAQIQLNYMDWKLQNAQDQYRILKERDIPIMVMEPVRGGTLASLCEESDALLKKQKPEMSVASWAIRYVVTFPEVITVLSGMSNMTQLKDNIATIENFIPLKEDDYKVLESALTIYQKLSIIPCTGCGYCNNCPHGIDIPSILAIYNTYSRGVSIGNRSPKTDFINRYNILIENKKGHRCIKCNQCVSHCPQHIDIPHWIEIVNKINEMFINNKYEIAIIGMHDPNYGNLLTAYAMFKVITDMGKTVIMLDRPLASIDKPSKDNFSIFRENPYPDYALSDIYPDKNSMKELNDKVDVFILPSDQNLRPLLFLNYDKYTLLDWVRDDKPKISYSSSFGTSSFEGDDNVRAEMGFYLSRFDAISVREESGIQYAKDNFGLDVEQVLDPVFLCPPDVFSKMADNNNLRIPSQPFLGSYILFPTDQRAVFLDNLQISLHLKNSCTIIGAYWTWVLENGHTLWKKDFIEQAYVEEFLACVQSCEYFITDSFHGVCFSIIFKKNFIVIYDNVQQSKSLTRFHDLLKKLNLKERIISSLDEKEGLKILQEDINYDEVHAILNAEIIRSMSWLNNTLNNVSSVKKNMSAYDILDKKIQKLKDMNDKLEDRLECLKKQTEYLENKIKEIEPQLPCNYWIIRKTIGFFRSLKNKGVAYTMILLIKKIKNRIIVHQ